MNKKIRPLTTRTFKCYFYRKVLFGLIERKREDDEHFFVIRTDNSLYEVNVSDIVSVGIQILENNP